MTADPVERILRRVVEAASDATLLVGRNGRIEAGNAAASALFGWSRDELRGLGIEDLIPVPERDAHRARRGGFEGARAMAQGREVSGLRADGSEFLAQVSLASLDDGRVLATVVDVTARERFAPTPPGREWMLQLFIEQAPAALAMFDRNMRYLAVSRRWITDYRLGAQPVLGRSHYAIFPETPQRWLDIHQRGLAGEAASADEDRFDRADGTVQWIRWDIRPWRMPPGRVGGIVIFSEDISVRKRQDEERERSRAGLNRRRGNLERLVSREVATHTLSAVAHDLHQPLSAVAAYCEAALQIVKSGRTGDERLGHALRSGAQQAHRAGKVMRELLHSLRKGDVRTEPVRLDSVVQTALSIVRADADFDFAVTVTPAAACGPVRADRRQLEKVLVNLVLNSLEAMRDGHAPAPALDVSWREADDGTAQVTVADNGPGFAPGGMPRIFEPFYSTKPDGVGMGLAICRSIVESLGGTMWAEQGSPGAVLHFKLPLFR